MFRNGNGRRLPSVLLIDDDMVSREVVATVLTMSGYTVATAASGEDSLKLLDGGGCSPEVILMDTQMPGLSGGALIAQLRNRSKAVLYAISGSDVPDEVANGADGFLLKPLGPEALQRILEKHATLEEPAAAAEMAVIDSRVLGQFRSMMPEKSVREIYEAVLSDLKKRQSALQTAIEGEDVAELRRIGHALKGGCGMAGAQQAARLGEMLECGGDDLEYMRSVVAQLPGAIADLQRMLNAEFSTAGPDPINL